MKFAYLNETVSHEDNLATTLIVAWLSVLELLKITLYLTTESKTATAILNSVV